MNDGWMRFSNGDELPSPALVLHAERIEANVLKMLSIAGGADRLRPHVKTHKIPQLVALQISLGITKFKCATIAEAEMTAAAGASDVLLALQAVGPNVRRLLELKSAFPSTRFSTIADDGGAAGEMARTASAAGVELDVYLDLDVGMGRTGIIPGAPAADLYEWISRQPGLRAAGLHAYDGHLHQTDVEERKNACEAAFAKVGALVDMLGRKGLSVPAVVAGGTPTFPMHAARKGVECSPGTTVLWDAGYARKLPDMDFLPAATLLCRVISKPGSGRICLDLGHKAVASEMPHPRVWFPRFPEASFVSHSEEHLVLEARGATDLAVGDVVHGIPSHVCPTVALHSAAYVVRGGIAAEQWPVTARARSITI
jgi:D-serine deaminase-like pyridoxal phosphate-dependent protein